MKILDVGCGGGILSESLARCGATVTGIDPSPSVISAAKNHAPPSLSLTYVGPTSIEEFQTQTSAKFDAICILEVLEHTTNPISLISSASKLLHPGGKLFVSTMNKTLKSHLLAILAAEHVARILPVGTHDWSKFLSPEEVESMANDCGMQQAAVSGMIVDIPSLLFSSLDATKFRWRLDPSDVDVNWIGSYTKLKIEKLPIFLGYLSLSHVPFLHAQISPPNLCTVPF